MKRQANPQLSSTGELALAQYEQALRVREDLRHRFGYRMAESIPLHRLAQIMGHDSLDTTKLYIQGTRHDLQRPLKPSRGHKRCKEKAQ